jgi:hypothetical protein
MDPRWLKETPTDSPLDVYERPSELRRAVRRAARVSCEIVSHYGDEPEIRLASDVSPFGMWIETPMPFHPGAEIVVAFRSPRHEGREMMVFATVTRIVSGRKRSDRGPLGMGVEFSDLGANDREEMAMWLAEAPPRPSRRAA